MNNRTQRAIAIACLVAVSSSGAVSCIEAFAIGRGAETAEFESGWIVEPTDNVCGLSDPRMLSRPARIDHPRLLAATPEMKRITEEGIDPNSPMGVMLRQHGVDRVLRAAEFVREREGNCSVWKRIRHRDGRAIPDLSEQVLERL